jgi:hypothetical protein
MPTRRQESKGWLGRIADDIYLGTLAVAAAFGLAALAALLVQFALDFTHWAEQLD